MRAIIAEKGFTSAKDVGLLMKELMARHRGRADGKRAQEIARSCSRDRRPKPNQPRRREEVEVKLPCEGPRSGPREQLQDLGATLRAQLHFESNDLLTTIRRAVSRRPGASLRLRRAGGRRAC